jgi:amidophosphoribosyltransferase
VETREKCGVVGVSVPGKGAAPYLYRGLRALQHRGQESAGIVTASHGQLYTRKARGLVHEVFDRESLESLRGSVGIGHVRYGTTGVMEEDTVQPINIGMGDDELALGHNGDLVNFRRLRTRLTQMGVEFLGSADTEAMGQLIAQEFLRSRDMPTAIRRAMGDMSGGYAVTLVHNNRLYGFRDPFGIRPLCLGTLEGGYALASESVALELMGGRLIRDVAPGEVIVVERGNVLHASKGATSPKGFAHCMFEWVYFSRPDSIMDGKIVYEVRHRIGATLARESPIEADVVVPVPDSSRPQALGFSEISKIPYAEGLIKSRFVERTFILPDQKRREEEVRVKLHPLPGVLKDKRVVLMDDSIVRGTTLKEIVSMVRDAGARQVHLRVGCPPIVAPCYFGIDMKERKELVAHDRTEEEVGKLLGADSLSYLSIPGLMESIGLPKSLCTGCLTGKYPVDIPQEHQRFQRQLTDFTP